MNTADLRLPSTRALEQFGFVGLSFVLSLGSAAMSLWMTSLATPWPSVWLPNAVVLSLRVLLPRAQLRWLLAGFLPGLLACQWVAGRDFGADMLVSGLGNALEIALAWALLKRLGCHVHTAAAYALRVAVAVLVAPLLTGLLAASLRWWLFGDGWWPQFTGWAVDDALGMGVLMPGVLALRSHLNDPAPVRLPGVSSAVRSALVASAAYWLIAGTADSLVDPDVPVAVILLLAMQGMGFRAASGFAGVALWLQDLLLDRGLTSQLSGQAAVEVYPHVVLLVLLLAVIYARALVAELRMVSASEHDARERADALLSATHSLVVVLDCQGRIEHFNETTERLTGHTLAELRHSDWFDHLLPESIRDSQRAIFDQIIHGELTTASSESPILTRAGSECSILWQHNRLLRHGRVAGSVAFGIDITERKRAEAALRASEARTEELAQRLKLAVTSAGIGTWEFELASNALRWDERMCEMYGVDPSTLSRSIEDWRRVVHPDDRAATEADAQRALQSNGLYASRFRVIRPDGEVRHIHAHAQFVYADDGRPVRAVGVNFDVTERLRGEEALRRSADLLQRTARIGCIGGWSYEPDRDLLEWTEQTRRIFAVDAELPPTLDALIGFFDDPGRATLAAALYRGISVGQPFDLCLPMTAADGESLWVRMVAQAEMDGSRCLRLSGVAQDLTQQRHSEQAASAATSRLLLALRAGGIGIWEVDLVSGEQFWDAQMHALLGVDPGDGEEALELLRSTLDNRDLLRARAEVAAGRGLGSSFEHEYEIRRGDGELRYLKVQSAVMADPHSGSPRLVGATWDCTAQRLLESSLRERQDTLQTLVEQQTLSAVQARQRAERAAAMQAEFLANVSHELRTPLHAILGFITLADEDLADAPEGLRTLAESARGRMARSGKAARRLLALVDDLLDLAKLESGRFDLLREPRNVAVLLDTAVDELAPIFAARCLRVERRYAPAPPVAADERRLVQVFRNVLANAARFSPEGGCILLQIVAAECNGRVGVDVVVEDEGVGVPGDELEAIFDKFVQSSRAPNKKAGGTGLGLPIAREIMRAHGGEIRADNRPQGGARFLLHLPCEQAVAMEGHAGLRQVNAAEA